MRIASLDLGSNTFLMLVCDVEKNKTLRVVANHSQTVRLFQGLGSSRRLHPEALARAEDCFKKYKKIINELSVDKVLSAATSAARDVENAESFFSLGEKYNIPISIISGDEEARLSFLGVTNDLNQTAIDCCLVVDVGGGSTEIIFKSEAESQSRGLIFGKSLNIGSVRLFEKFKEKEIWNKDEFASLDDFIRETISQQLSADFVKNKSQMICVGGTPCYLAAIDQNILYREDKVHGYELSFEKLNHWRNHLSSLSVAQRVREAGIDERRADVIIYGTSILMGVMKHFQMNSFVTSTKGVRYGLALNEAQI